MKQSHLFIVFFRLAFLLFCSTQALAIEQERYTLGEIPSAVARVNAESSSAEQIRGKETYKAFRTKDQRLPSWWTLVDWYRKKHGNAKGLSAFVVPKKIYTLEEIPLAVARVNAESSSAEQIRGMVTYKAFRTKDQRLPSWWILLDWYKKEHGNAKGLSDFVFPEKFYTLEEIPSAVARVNAESSKEEQMRSMETYEAFRTKDQRLPSWWTLLDWYKKEYGDTKGFFDFVFSRNCERTMKGL